MSDTRLTLRVDFGPSRSIGPGKIRLLEAVERTGSISQAGRALGMSYRRAWLLIDDMNQCFRHAGGERPAGRFAGRRGGADRIRRRAGPRLSRDRDGGGGGGEEALARARSRAAEIAGVEVRRAEEDFDPPPQAVRMSCAPTAAR